MLSHIEAYALHKQTFKLISGCNIKSHLHSSLKIYSLPRRCPWPQPPQPPPPPPLSWLRGLRLAGGTPNPLTPPWRFGRSFMDGVERNRCPPKSCGYLNMRKKLNKCITYPQRHKKSYDLLLVMKTSQGTLQP
ncbi:hypothetical protein pdam_00019792, partial [Pocillopora damicornis]